MTLWFKFAFPYDSEHLFMCLNAVSIFLLIKFLFRYFAYFSLACFLTNFCCFLNTELKNYFYILDTVLYQVWFTNVFLKSVADHFSILQ